MFEFSEDERALQTEMRAITTDSKGREVLVGLTVEETERYMAHVRRFVEGNRDHAGRADYLALSEKHELARLAVIGAEVQARNDTSPRH